MTTEVLSLTEEQFNEKYGNVLVAFQSYYKYSFSFVGAFDDCVLYLTVGGNADDIYKFDVSVDKHYSVKELGFSFARIEKDGKIIEQCNNFW